jgi:NodT family efflux transporter outer membrane factor (OMF) lipoprotein
MNDSRKKISALRLSAISSASLIILLNGCSSMVDHKTDALASGKDFVNWVPRTFSESPLPFEPGQETKKPPQANDTNQLPKPSDIWWNDFNSNELSELVDTALTNNYDLRIAVSRLEQAERQAMITDANRYPTLNAFAGAETKGPALGAGTASSMNNYNSRNIYQFGFRASYEVDVWGKLGYQTQSALALARASVYNRQTVALTLVSDVTTTYFQLVSLTERVNIGKKNLRLAQGVAKAISKRVDIGEASIIELQQQQVTIALIESAIANLQLQRDRAANRLAVLVGKPPNTFNVTAMTLAGTNLPKINPGIPSELLCRRPDIRRAEEQLISAQEDVKAARANLLPSFSLNGEYGQGSFKLSELLSPFSLLYSLAGNLVGTVFDADKKENQLLFAKSKNKELLEIYANTVLSSLRDVEDALSGIRLTGTQRKALSDALSRNNKLLELSRMVYEKGALDFVGLQQIQRDVFNAQDSEANARFEQVRATVDLYKAIGGGTTSTNDPCNPDKNPATELAATIASDSYTPNTAENLKKEAK